MRMKELGKQSEFISGKNRKKYNKLEINNFFNLKKSKKFTNYLAIGTMIATGVIAAFYPFHTAKIIGAKTAFAQQTPAIEKITKTQNVEEWEYAEFTPEEAKEFIHEKTKEFVKGACILVALEVIFGILVIIGYGEKRKPSNKNKIKPEKTKN